MATAIYLCNRLVDEPVPDRPSISRDCSNCQAPVWVDPNAYAQHSEERDLVIVCNECWANDQAGILARTNIEEAEDDADADD